MERQIKKKLAKKKEASDDARTSQENSDTLPLDLLPDTLKDMPVKTLARFICVSKHWASIIRDRDFAKAYLTNSSNRHHQRLIFTFKSKRNGTHSFFSTNGDRSSSLPWVASYIMECNSQPHTAISPSIHGLICHGPPSKLMVYNPSTKRSFTLPKVDSDRSRMYHYLGYDPIDGDYKLLCMTRGPHFYRGRGLAQNVQVFTLGNDNSWRMVEDIPYPHSPESPHICTDGVLYYGVYLDSGRRMRRKDHVVMSFDVQSEKFRLLELPKGRAMKFTRMIRYNGKLGLMFSGLGDSSSLVEWWVLEDASKDEWSSKSFYFPILSRFNTTFRLFCVIDDSGEFVLAPDTLNGQESFYVLCYDPNRNSTRRVDIEGITEQNIRLWDNDSDRCTISIFPDQVENLMFL